MSEKVHDSEPAPQGREAAPHRGLVILPLGPRRSTTDFVLGITLTVCALVVAGALLVWVFA